MPHRHEGEAGILYGTGLVVLVPLVFSHVAARTVYDDVYPVQAVLSAEHCMIAVVAGCHADPVSPVVYGREGFFCVCGVGVIQLAGRPARHRVLYVVLAPSFTVRCEGVCPDAHYHAFPVVVADDDGPAYIPAECKRPFIYVGKLLFVQKVCIVKDFLKRHAGEFRQDQKIYV